MVRLISSGSPFEKTIGYSRAVVDGDMIYVAGTTGYDYATMMMPEDVTQQTRNALATIAGVLEEAGASLQDVVRLRTYLASRDLAAVVGPVLGEVFGDIRPAGTMVIAEMIDPAMQVEIEVTARRGAGQIRD